MFKKSVNISTHIIILYFKYIIIHLIQYILNNLYKYITTISYIL